MSNLYYTVDPDTYLGRNAFKCMRKSTGGAWERSMAFDFFIFWLVELGRSYHTIRVYSDRVAIFLDYLEVGIAVCGSADITTYMRLSRLYHSYLTQGINSMSSLVQAIDRRRPSPMVSKKTSLAHHAAVEQLIIGCHEGYDGALDCSVGEDAMCQAKLLAELRSVGVPKSEQELAYLEKVYGRQVRGKKNSKRLRIFSHLPKIRKSLEPYGEDKFFPLDKITQLINEATSYRDGAFWALMGASSLRASEALQVLWEDIDLVTREIFAVEPSERENYLEAYEGLTAAQRDQLSWKGRTTKYTLLLQPYGDMFFDLLELYMQYEYQPGVANNFVFQSQYGYPLRFCDYGSVIVKPFATAAAKVLGSGLKPYRMKLHSLRHSFCVYMKNFVEHTHGVGLSDYEIMALTGHSQISSVARYAVLDIQLLNEKLYVAFADHKANAGKSVDELLIGFHEKRIAYLQVKIAEEKVARDKKTQEAA
ncbi:MULTISPECIES: tyrosine-type recombinase/integrase [unclassified Pseudomonas]|uniref:Tyrosine-type recombinase/integrase n=1 Tax=Pseudomonas sp. MYb327 TaxID=2745230 RepID=A0AAU8E6K6_9PSED